MDSKNAESEYSLNWEGHIQHVRKAFNRLFHSNELCDVTLYAEGKKIGAHKVFLSACSKYFDQLFKDFKDERPVIVLKDVQFDILQHILNFIYSGQTNIEVYQLKQFLETASFLKIDGLSDNHLKRKRKASFNSDNTNDPNNILLDAQSEVAKNIQQNTLPKPLKLYKLTHSPSKDHDISNANYPDFSKAPVIGKYPSVPVETPASEWLSEYEIESQSSIADSSLDEDMNPPVVEHPVEENIDHSEILKITVIKSEPKGIDSKIEVISSFNQIDFSNSLDAEIDIVSDSGEDGILEKELLKTSFASIDDQGYYLCTICNKSYVKKDSLKKHFAIHVNNTTCTICGKILSRKTHLIRHYLHAHSLSLK